LIKEISLFENEKDLWIVTKGISNSAGTLALHLTGNLNHFVGNVLGNTGYVRNREAEFSDRDIPKKEIIEGIEQVKTVVQDTLESLTDVELNKIYPREILDSPITTEFFLNHLHGHLNYHLGQINYHRRILS
jgi:hypothetical protein